MSVCVVGEGVSLCEQGCLSGNILEEKTLQECSNRTEKAYHDISSKYLFFFLSLSWSNE